MTRAELQQQVARAIGEVAPEVDAAGLTPRTRIREDLDIDSFDFLQVLLAVQRRVGVEVPEADYRQVATFGGIVDYLAARLDLPGPAAPAPEPHHP